MLKLNVKRAQDLSSLIYFETLRIIIQYEFLHKGDILSPRKIAISFKFKEQIVLWVKDCEFFDFERFRNLSIKERFYFDSKISQSLKFKDKAIFDKNSDFKNPAC